MGSASPFEGSAVFEGSAARGLGGGGGGGSGMEGSGRGGGGGGESGRSSSWSESTGYMQPAMKLEFDGLYVTEQPEDDDIKGQWDRLVLNTPSFPNNYWDKFVKRKVLDKITSIDIKYQIWKFGVVFTDNTFLYLCWYMLTSLLGHYNNFFFAAHLLDIAMGVKTLRTILSSVTHNGKQLMMTVGPRSRGGPNLVHWVAFNLLQEVLQTMSE
ncbi:hypothetical protein CRUP_009328, partial [Coryphaenoides rupestris]